MLMASVWCLVWIFKESKSGRNKLKKEMKEKWRKWYTLGDGALWKNGRYLPGLCFQCDFNLYTVIISDCNTFWKTNLSTNLKGNFGNSEVAMIV